MWTDQFNKLNINLNKNQLKLRKNVVRTGCKKSHSIKKIKINSNTKTIIFKENKRFKSAKKELNVLQG